MAQSPMTKARLLTIAWCVAQSLTTGGCAHHTPPDQTATPATESQAPTTLLVTNSNWSDVRIYLVRGTVWMRLGTVTTNSTTEFTIPGDFLSGASTVTLVADPVGAHKPWSTPLPTIAEGDAFELVVENFLQYSHLVVR